MIFPDSVNFFSHFFEASQSEKLIFSDFFTKFCNCYTKNTTHEKLSNMNNDNNNSDLTFNVSDEKSLSWIVDIAVKSLTFDAPMYDGVSYKGSPMNEADGIETLSSEDKTELLYPRKNCHPAYNRELTHLLSVLPYMKPSVFPEHDKVVYNLSYDHHTGNHPTAEDHFSRARDSEECENAKNLFEEFSTIEDAKEFKKFKLVGADYVVISNGGGKHPSYVRGWNYCELHLEKYDYYRLKDMTIYDLFEGIFRVKNHKFDTWYELFDGVWKVEKLPNNGILIHLSFGYGS